MIADLEATGWAIAYTDGSAEHHTRVGWVAGYGCVMLGEWEESWYVPCSLAQMNNRANVLAIIHTLEQMQGQIRNVVVATDSQYAYDGLTGSAYRWRNAGWVNKQGPVASVHL